MKQLLRVIVVSALAWLAGLPVAWAQTYTATADAATQAAYPWIDISSTGTQLPLADDAVSTDISLGFSFTFGSSSYTTVNISANGMLQFGVSTSGGYQNSALPLTGSGSEPNIDAAMLLLWDDLNPNGDGSDIRYRTIGTAPNRVFVVSFLTVPYYCSDFTSGCNYLRRQTRTLSATFQVQIYEQGHFVYRYGAVDGSGGAHTSGPSLSNPQGATVGYELTNTDYSQYSYRAANVPNNRTILWQRPGAIATPGGFNAFDTGTPTGSITGVITTKVAGSAFNVAVAALNTARTAVQSSFTGNVRVEVLDASNNSGALNTTTNCRSSWSVAAGTSATTLTFVTGDAGRRNVSFTVAEAFREARIRVSYPDTGTATVIGCSTDNFAIRPASFTGVSATDATSTTAGTTRTLANAASSGGNVHKAGQPFTVRATAVNSAGTTTANYTGTPSALLSACTGAACGGTLGALALGTTTTEAGVFSTQTASYSEAGAFSLQLVDSSFAAVDASDGSTAAERQIVSSALTVGRFVPDHFDVVALVTPVLRTFNSGSCTTRSFTYLGQPFGYATTPQASVIARNAAGATTVNYPNAKLAALSVSQGYTPTVSATPGLDSSAATLPSLTASGSGMGLLAAQSSDRLTMVRSATTPVAPFAASIALTWSVSDGSEAAVTGNGSITTTTPLVYSSISFDAGNEFRYGQLRLGSAYGNELLPLAVPVETQHWNGTSFVTNAADQCTALPTSSLSLASFRGSLAACDTAPSTATVTVSSGRAVMRWTAPGNGRKGSVDGTVQLGATLVPTTAVRCAASPGATSAAVPANLPWLQGKAPGGTTYDQNPSARFSFGQYKSQLIQLREMY